MTLSLGQDRQEKTELDNAGMVGEDLLVWEYINGLTISIGKESGKALFLSTTKRGIATDLGVQVGDKAQAAIDIYKVKYQPAINRHNNEQLVGWFWVGEEAVVILDFERDDNQLIDPDLTVTPATLVESIIISYWKYFN